MLPPFHRCCTLLTRLVLQGNWSAPYLSGLCILGVFFERILPDAWDTANTRGLWELLFFFNMTYDCAV